MGFDYVAVPWPVGAPDPQPQLRAELETLGFRLLGGCALDNDAIDDVVSTAKTFGEHAGEFAHWAAQPGQVFAAPDGTSFAQLAWLWECRYGAFTTVRADGSLIQTMTEWGADPVWPVKLIRFRRWTDRRTEQLTLATDPEAEIVAGIGPAWEAHQRRVQEAGPIPSHAELADFVAVWTAESDARSAWSTRMQVVSAAVALAVVACLVLVVSAVLGPQPWWSTVLVGLAAMVTVLELFPRVWMRSRRWRSLRRSILVPVPGRDTASP